MKGSIEGRSHDIMDQERGSHAYMTCNRIENKEHYSAQTDIIKDIEEKGRLREQTSRRSIEAFESREQGIGG